MFLDEALVDEKNQVHGLQWVQCCDVSPRPKKLFAAFNKIVYFSDSGSIRVICLKCSCNYLLSGKRQILVFNVHFIF